MAGSVERTVELTGRLDALLSAAATERSREWWQRYLKGEAEFRGVPMAEIRRSVRLLWREERLAERATEELLALAHAWFRQPASEDKLAATLLLAEQLPARLGLEHLGALARPLTEGWVADWNTCDWYAVKALHAYLAAEPAEFGQRATGIAAWSSAPVLWQRRAAVVAFVKLAEQRSPLLTPVVDTVLEACAANLVSDERFAHTGPGWLLRELSRTQPERVARFVGEHPELSPEATRMATARLRSGPYRRR